MIPIDINLLGVADEFNLSVRDIQDLAQTVKNDLTVLIARNWDIEAKNNLSKSRDEYRRSILVVDKGRYEGAIVLKGVVPNMVEQGASAFDMKTAFEKSTKAKLNQKGEWYISIPFRHAVPSASGFSSLFSDEPLPPEVYNAVRANNGNALQQSQVPKPHDKAGVRRTVAAGNQVFQAYRHKSSIYAGLKRQTKTYNTATQGQYNTFRRAGKNSDKNAFIHSGITARRLADRAIQATDIPGTVDKIVDNYLSNMGF